MSDKSLGLATYHNASLSSSEKLRNLVFLPFLGCKGISHLNYSCVAGSVGYNMLYRMMRLDSIVWRNVQARFNNHLRKYLESHTEKEKDGVVCLVADDTDIAKSGRNMEHIGRVYSHTEHRHILQHGVVVSLVNLLLVPLAAVFAAVFQYCRLVKIFSQLPVYRLSEKMCSLAHDLVVLLVQH